MHANIKSNLRRLLTGTEKRLEKIPPSAAAIYLDYFRAHQRLLTYVSVNDGSESEYNRKSSTIINFMVNECKAATSSQNCSGYYSESSLGSSSPELNVEKVKSEKLNLEKQLKEKAEMAKANEKLLNTAIKLDNELKLKDERLQEVRKLLGTTRTELQQKEEELERKLKVSNDQLQDQRLTILELNLKIKNQRFTIQELNGKMETQQQELNQTIEALENELKEEISKQKNRLDASKEQAEHQRSTIRELRAELKMALEDAKRPAMSEPVKTDELAEKENDRFTTKTVKQLTAIYEGINTLKKNKQKLKPKN